MLSTNLSLHPFTKGSIQHSSQDAVHIPPSFLHFGMCFSKHICSAVPKDYWNPVVIFGYQRKTISWRETIDAPRRGVQTIESPPGSWFWSFAQWTWLKTLASHPCRQTVKGIFRWTKGRGSCRYSLSTMILVSLQGATGRHFICFCAGGVSLLQLVIKPKWFMIDNICDCCSLLITWKSPLHLFKTWVYT